MNHNNFLEVSAYCTENTCLLAVYGLPLSKQITGEYVVEQRMTMTKYRHVVRNVAAINEKTGVGFPKAATIKPGFAYPVYTIGRYGPGEFRRYAWHITDKMPLFLPVGERPSRGPTKRSTRTHEFSYKKATGYSYTKYNVHSCTD